MEHPAAVLEALALDLERCSGHVRDLLREGWHSPQQGGGEFPRSEGKIPLPDGGASAKSPPSSSGPSASADGEDAPPGMGSLRAPNVQAEVRPEWLRAGGAGSVAPPVRSTWSNSLGRVSSLLDRPPVRPTWSNSLGRSSPDPKEGAFPSEEAFGPLAKGHAEQHATLRSCRTGGSTRSARRETQGSCLSSQQTFEDAKFASELYSGASNNLEVKSSWKKFGKSRSLALEGCDCNGCVALCTLLLQQFPKVVRSKFFDFFMGFVIAANVACIGMEISFNLDGKDTTMFRMLEHVFLAMYIVELILRFAMDGTSLLQSRLVLFDLVLVVIGVVSSWIVAPILETQGGTLGEADALIDKVLMFRAMRLLRLVRAVRLVVQFQTLWRLVNGLMNSTDILCSTVALLLLTLYVFACIGVEVITNEPSLREDPFTDDIVVANLNNLPMTMMTLTRFVTMDSLSAVFFPLMKIRPVVATLFYCALVLVISIALMNLITAVLVEKAIQHTALDAETERFQRKQRLKTLSPAIRKVFHLIDNGSGQITKREVQETILAHGGLLGVPPELQQMFKPEMILQVFELLDADYSGSVDEEEFVFGLMQMAMSDIPFESHQMLKLLRQNRRKMESIHVMLKYVVDEVMESYRSRGEVPGGSVPELPRSNGAEP